MEKNKEQSTKELSQESAFPRSLLSDLTLKEYLNAIDLPNNEALFVWAYSYLALPPVRKLSPPLGTQLMSGKGKLSLETKNYLTTIKKKGRSPSGRKVLDCLRRGARQIIWHQNIRESVPEWKAWDKRAQGKIRSLKTLLTLAQQFDLSVTALEEIQNKIKVIDLVHREIRDYGSGHPWLQIEKPDARAYFGLSTKPTTQIGKKSPTIKQAAWNNIIVPLVEYLRPFFAHEIRRDRRINKVPQGAYKAAARILNTEFSSAFPNDPALVRQRYRTKTRKNITSITTR